jgi:hypothetical protein
LIMLGSYARRTWAVDHPWAPNEADQEAFIEEVGRDWGGPVGSRLERRARSETRSSAVGGRPTSA